MPCIVPQNSCRGEIGRAGGPLRSALDLAGAAAGSLTVAKINAAGFDIAPINNIAYDERESVAAAGDRRFFLPLLDR